MPFLARKNAKIPQPKMPKIYKTIKSCTALYRTVMRKKRPEAKQNDSNACLQNRAEHPAQLKM